MIYFIKYIFFSIIIFSGVYSKPNNYEYTKIINVPDLSFFNDTYTGLDILQQMDLNILSNKSIGVFCNHTAVNRNNEHLLDILNNNVKNIKVEAIFEPEHGLWGIDDKRMSLIGNKKIDSVSGARVFNLLKRSLYPPDWIMKKIDIILVDIQDTGIRYSTYISSISKILESASKFDIPVIVLDRPNPL